MRHSIRSLRPHTPREQRPQPGSVALGIALVALTLASSAAAQSNASNQAEAEAAKARAAGGATDSSELPSPPTTRRGGFVLGASGTYGSGSFSGYPNELSEIGNPDSRVEFDTPFYTGGSLFIGGAIRDWLTLALGLTGGGAQQDDLTLSGGMFALRIESYPAFALGGIWEDIGLVNEFGAGNVVVMDEDEDIVADGGNMLSFGVGAFWQPLELWHFAFGPGFMYTHQSSDSFAANSFGLSLRAVFYGVQP